MSAQEAGPVRLVVTLSMAGLIAGLVLVGVYLLTKPAIEQNRAEALERAILEVVPGSSDFRTLRLEDGALVPVDGQASSEEEDVVYAALNDRGARVGWAIPGAGPGFMDTIRLIYGFDSDRRVIVGMAVLESRETPGLGDKIDDDEAFHENFEGLEVEPEIVPVSDKTKPNQVDTITGATISSKAVVHIMNDTIERWMPVLTSQAVAEGGDARR